MLVDGNGDMTSLWNDHSIFLEELMKILGTSSRIVLMWFCPWIGLPGAKKCLTPFFLLACLLPKSGGKPFLFFHCFAPIPTNTHTMFSESFRIKKERKILCIMRDSFKVYSKL